jgi:hypothetical protein
MAPGSTEGLGVATHTRAVTVALALPPARGPGRPPPVAQAGSLSGPLAAPRQCGHDGKLLIVLSLNGAVDPSQREASWAP